MRLIQIFPWCWVGPSIWAAHISTRKFERLPNFHDGTISISEMTKHDHEHLLPHIPSFMVSSSPIHRYLAVSFRDLACFHPCPAASPDLHAEASDTSGAVHLYSSSSCSSD
uniref:Uncharacterized protein n=1 Tax=Oryza brachyantha TaxID=4533 RepID=J3LLW5_ORYBR